MKTFEKKTFKEVFMDTLMSNGWNNDDNDDGTMRTIVATEYYQSNNGVCSSVKLWATEAQAYALEFHNGYAQIFSSKGEKVWESSDNRSYKEWNQAAKIISGRPFHDLSCGSWQVQKAISFLYNFMELNGLMMCYPTERGFLLVGKHK